jgi:hypothetical protein
MEAVRFSETLVIMPVYTASLVASSTPPSEPQARNASIDCDTLQSWKNTNITISLTMYAANL